MHVLCMEIDFRRWVVHDLVKRNTTVPNLLRTKRTRTWSLWCLWCDLALFSLPDAKVTKPDTPKSGIREETKTESHFQSIVVEHGRQKATSNMYEAENLMDMNLILLYMFHISHESSLYRATRKLSLSLLSDTWFWSRFSQHRWCEAQTVGET